MVNKKYEKLVFIIVMSFIMSCIMSFVVSFINLGFIDDFFIKWIEASIKAFVIAVPIVSIVVPISRKIVLKILKG